MLDTLEVADWDALPALGEETHRIAMRSKPSPELVSYLKSLPDCDDAAEAAMDWIDLSDMMSTPDVLIDADDRVLEAAEACLLLDYPMERPATRVIRAPDGRGFTRGDLMRAVLETYQAVYDTETRSQSGPTPPVEERGPAGGLLNRPESDGIYGIAMHDIEDLGVSGVCVHDVDGVVWLSLALES